MGKQKKDIEYWGEQEPERKQKQKDRYTDKKKKKLFQKKGLHASLKSQPFPQVPNISEKRQSERWEKWRICDLKKLSVEIQASMSISAIFLLSVRPEDMECSVRGRRENVTLKICEKGALRLQINHFTSMGTYDHKWDLFNPIKKKNNNQVKLYNKVPLVSVCQCIN